MKRIKLKLVLGVIILSSVGLIYSFTTAKKAGKEKGKRYEVIRSVDGKITVKDTIIGKNDNYSPQDYLNDLGYGSDNDIKIIDLAKELSHLNIDMEHHHSKDGQAKTVFITTDSINFDHKAISSDQPHEIIIKKEIKTFSKDGEQTINIETHELHEHMDSIISALHNGKKGHGVMVEKIIISDDSVETGDFKHFEIREDFNTDDLEEKIEETIIKVMENLDTTMSMTDFKVIHIDDQNFNSEHGKEHHEVKVKAFGAEKEDFTIVIVSEVPDTKGKKKNKTGKATSTSEFKLYPNPSKEASVIELNFNEKAITNLQVIDMNGKTIYNTNLGEIDGFYRHELDISDWYTGVYIVNIKHGEETIKEKLIVE